MKGHCRILTICRHTLVCTSVVLLLLLAKHHYAENIRAGVWTKSTLIYDIGINDGTDTAYYISQGYQVVAVDANPLLIGRAAATFTASSLNGTLHLLCAGIVEDDALPHEAETGHPLKFYVNRKNDWSSFTYEIGCRSPEPPRTASPDYCEEILVPITSCAAIVKRFGPAVYMKIDIEGKDVECLISVLLLGAPYLPSYLSVEAGDVENYIQMLSAHGYMRFKLVSMAHTLPKFYNETGIKRLGEGGASGYWGEDAEDFESGKQWRSKEATLIAWRRVKSIADTWWDVQAALGDV